MIALTAAAIILTALSVTALAFKLMFFGIRISNAHAVPLGFLQMKVDLSPHQASVPAVLIQPTPPHRNLDA